MQGMKLQGAFGRLFFLRLWGTRGAEAGMILGWPIRHLDEPSTSFHKLRAGLACLEIRTCLFQILTLVREFAANFFSETYTTGLQTARFVHQGNTKMPQSFWARQRPCPADPRTYCQTTVVSPRHKCHEPTVGSLAHYGGS